MRTKNWPTFFASVAIIAFGLYIYLPCSPEPIEVVHKKTAHERLERLIDLAEIDPLLDDFVAIDLDENLRDVRQKGWNQRAELGPFACCIEKCLQILREERDVFAGAIFQNERNPPEVPTPGIAGGGNAKAIPSLRPASCLLMLRLDGGVLFFRLGSFAPRLERDEEKGAISILHETQQTESDYAGRVLARRESCSKISSILRRRGIGSLE